MAHIKQQKKRILQDERNRQRNVAVKSRLATQMKKAKSAIEAKDAETLKTVMPETVSQIDRAARKGIIHKRTAARRKSRLQKAVAAI